MYGGTPVYTIGDDDTDDYLAKAAKMSIMPTGGSDNLEGRYGENNGCCGSSNKNNYTNYPNSKDLNVNRYATKKTIAQGMLDIALLTANASQLRYVLTLGDDHQFYKLMLGLIITSITLQVLVGILFLVLGIIDINEPENHFSANVLNNIAVVLIFVISVINVIINAFGIQHTNNNTPGTVTSIPRKKR